MLAQLGWGRAWPSCPKPRRRSWLRKQSAQALQTAIKTRVVSTGRRGGPSWTTPASGGTPERRLWALQREARRARPGAQDRVSIAHEFPQRRAGTIEEALHPGALASRVVILTHRFALHRIGRGHRGAALAEAQVAALI